MKKNYSKPEVRVNMISLGSHILDTSNPSSGVDDTGTGGVVLSNDRDDLLDDWSL